MEHRIEQRLLTAEQAQQIEAAGLRAILCLKHSKDSYSVKLLSDLRKALSTIRSARANFQSETSIENNPADFFKAEQEPVAWYDKIKGMEVSMDVSTGEEDECHRIFGRVDGVMLQSCGSQEDTILVIEDSRNFAAPVESVKQEPIDYLMEVNCTKCGATESGILKFKSSLLLKEQDQCQSTFEAGSFKAKQEQLADSEIKAAYVNLFGNDAKWLSSDGSYFIEGFKAGKNAAPQPV